MIKIKNIASNNVPPQANHQTFEEVPYVKIPAIPLHENLMTEK